MLNNGINRFNFPTQLRKINNPPKVEEKTEEKPVEQKVETQKQQVEQPKVSSAEVLSRLAEIQKDAVVNAPKTQAPENVAPKQASEGARTGSFTRQQMEFTLGKSIITNENALDFTKDKALK